jgi:hypothetical protein
MYPHHCEAEYMPTVAKKKIETPIDAALHQQRFKVLSAATGRRMGPTANIAVGDFVTFEQMHAEYERRHGVKIDVAAEAAKLARRCRLKRS